MSDLNAYFSSTDVDWFAPDLNGMIAHFATGSFGFIHPEVHTSYRDMKALAEYIFVLESMSEVSVVEENLRDFKSPEERERSIGPFVNMASKGLFSYDVLEFEGKDQGYRLIACPSTPLTVDMLPAKFNAAIRLSHVKSFKNKLYPSDWEDVST